MNQFVRHARHRTTSPTRTVPHPAPCRRRRADQDRVTPLSPHYMSCWRRVAVCGTVPGLLVLPGPDVISHMTCPRAGDGEVLLVSLLALRSRAAGGSGRGGVWVQPVPPGRMWPPQCMPFLPTGCDRVSGSCLGSSDVLGGEAIHSSPSVSGRRWHGTPSASATGPLPVAMRGSGPGEAGGDVRLGRLLAVSFR